MTRQNPGTIVMIYDDPITRRHPEGLAELLSVYRSDVGDGLTMYTVKFCDDGYVTTRTVYNPQD